uniref:Ig-like domain-containing protein n=1 Tax=Catharus ustulatus TaxID=91951 RepID=A0A8C3TN97_CATUS
MTPLAIICTPTPYSLFLSLNDTGFGIGAYIAQWPEGILQRAGDSLTISCYQNYSNFAYMFWYQQLPRSGLKLIVSSSTWSQNVYEDGYSEAKFEVKRQNTDYSLMTIKNLTPKDEATYFCAASDHTVGTKLTVMGKNDEIIPPAVAIFSPSKQEIQQKSKATLVCLASGFYPDHLTLVWKVNGVKRTEGVGTDESSTKNGSTYSLTSRLRMPAWEWFNPLNRFECVASFFQNGTTQSINKFIHGDAGE